MSNLLFGLSTTAIGMLVVFFGLAVLIVCISAMHALSSGKKEKQQPAPAPAPAPAVPAAETEEYDASEEDTDLVAAITAAIMAVWQNEESGFIVRRVRRVQSSTARARAARDEQIFSRL